MTSPRRARSERHPPRHAAVLVDYANLHALLAERLDAPGQVDTYIAEALGALRRYLDDDEDTSVVLTAAYADFDALERRATASSLQETLYEQGVEPRFVPSAPGECTPQVQIAVDATTLLHRRPDVRTFALVTGDRPLLPLVHALRREGAHAFVPALDPPPPGEHAHGDGDVFMDFLNLLSDAARRDLLQSGEMPARRPDADREQAPAAAQHIERLDDEMLFSTLEITEEHFGQYDEVYLTPLLRKLSDVLGERFDPKALVSDLEEARAVRLEKRRGYPYDYTVLIVNRDHPDVQEMEEDFYDGTRSRYEHGGSSSSASTDDYHEADEHDPDDYAYGDEYDPDDYDYEDEADSY